MDSTVAAVVSLLLVRDALVALKATRPDTYVVPEELFRGLDKAQTIRLAGLLGIVRRVTTKTDAREAVLRWLNDIVIARQLIAY